MCLQCINALEQLGKLEHIALPDRDFLSKMYKEDDDGVVQFPEFLAQYMDLMEIGVTVNLAKHLHHDIKSPENVKQKNADAVKSRVNTKMSSDE